MRGYWNMRPWEQEKWTQEFKLIIEMLDYDLYKKYDLSKDDICPANVVDALRALGWMEEDHNHNGWECDNWIYFSNMHYDFQLVLKYCGYTFSMELYRKDIDD